MGHLETASALLTGVVEGYSHRVEQALRAGLETLMAQTARGSISVLLRAPGRHGEG